MSGSGGGSGSAIKPDWRIRLLTWALRRRRAIETMSPAQIQAANARPIPPWQAGIFLGARPDLPRVVDRELPGRHGNIPIRLYYPHTGDRLPLVVFFHGGGWVTGTLETHDVMCRTLARAANAIVAAVDYRLAPQYRFPIPLEDCYDATVWLARHRLDLGAADGSLGVAGDSAGGNLAAGVCLLARDCSGPPIDYQVLIYPAVDATLSCDSHRRLAEAPLLRPAAMRFFIDAHARKAADIYNPFFSPLLARDPSNLPPALVLTAEYDPLHDEGEAYGRKLQVAGVPVEWIDYPGMVHGFLSFPRFCRSAAAAFDAIARFIGRHA